VSVVTLAGGIGGARFLRGVKAALAARPAGQTRPGGPEPAEITVIGNTGDDVTLHGLRICPDLDTVMYTLGGGVDPERGWGRAAETWQVKTELAAYGVEPRWFGLGDRDLATHLVRTQMLAAGYPLSAVTEALCARWQPGVRLLPMSDDRVETHVVVDRTGVDRDGTDRDGADRNGTDRNGAYRNDTDRNGTDRRDADRGGSDRRAIHFQEWWVRYHAELPARAFVSVGAEVAKPAPGVLAAIASAEVVLLAPSNPVVSVGPILAVPGIRDALRAAPGPVVGLSPIVGGAPVRGMADACLAAIGVPTSAEAVGRHYGARAEGGLLDGWLVDTADAGATVPGVEVVAVPLLMTDLAATTAMALAALDLAGRLRRQAGP
jgi:LPPG:FO 2-phospho-L-lactate transferase